jgi:hypothetical protein
MPCFIAESLGVETVEEQRQWDEIGQWEGGMVAEFAGQVMTEVRGGSDFLRRKLDWERRVAGWLDHGNVSPQSLQTRRERASVEFAKRIDGVSQTGPRPVEQIRRALSDILENNVYPRTRLGMPIAGDGVTRDVPCSQGVSLLFSWNLAMNEYAGNWGMLERRFEPDRGFAKMLYDVESAAIERLAFARNQLVDDQWVHVGSIKAALDAMGPDQLLKAQKEFHGLHVERLGVVARAVSDAVVLSEVMEAFGGGEPAITGVRREAAGIASLLAEAEFLFIALGHRLGSVSASSLAVRCAEAIRPVSKGFPGFKNVAGIRSRQGSQRVVLDLQVDGGKPMRLFLDAASVSPDRLDRLYEAMQRVDAFPRSGYAAMNYRKRSEGDLDDRAVNAYFSKNAMWSPADDSVVSPLGVLPASCAGEDLVVLVEEDALVNRGYLIHSALVHWVGYLAGFDRMGISGYRPEGRFATFYRGDVPVAHAWARTEIADGIPFGAVPVKIAERVIAQPD